jgi:hypothetical protein
VLRGAPTALFAIFSLGLVGWLAATVHVARLELDAGGRLLRLIGWPSLVAGVGCVWTVLLVLSVATALRAEGARRVALLAVTTAAHLLVIVAMPATFRSLGYIGVSTSEFLDALLPLLGGALPGGQATLGGVFVAGGLLVLTAWEFAEWRVRTARARSPT